MAIFAGALAFATTIQLWQGLNHTQHFRMDNLFPLSRFTRERAVRKLVVVLQLLQALMAALALIIAGLNVTAGIVFLVVIAISLITLTFASNKKKA